VRSRLKHGQFETWLSWVWLEPGIAAYNSLTSIACWTCKSFFCKLILRKHLPSTYWLHRQRHRISAMNFIQQAKGGRVVTHQEPSSQRDWGRELQSTPAAEESEPLKLFTSKPEVVAIIPKAGYQGNASHVVQAPSQSAFHPIATPCDISRGWYLLRKQHFLFCVLTQPHRGPSRTHTASCPCDRDYLWWLGPWLVNWAGEAHDHLSRPKAADGG